MKGNEGARGHNLESLAVWT